tara:strand:- start:694 stop:831 length:138 start_codon:yes stop_codon:yes gene_type:complete
MASSIRPWVSARLFPGSVYAALTDTRQAAGFADRLVVGEGQADGQ